MTDTTTEARPQPPTPTLDRMKDIHDRSQTVGEFIEWLGSDDGGHLFIGEWEHKMECRHRVPKRPGSDAILYPGAECRFGRLIATDEHLTEDEGTDLGACPRCDGTGLVDRVEPRERVHGESIERILARFFGIDLREAERERMALLDWVREQS